jgi:hypothetical protein
MTRVGGQVPPVQPVTVATLPVRVYSKPSAESARAPLGAAKLTASSRARVAERARLVSTRNSMLPSRSPKWQAHTYTFLWREVVLGFDDTQSDMVSTLYTPSMGTAHPSVAESADFVRENRPSDRMGLVAHTPALPHHAWVRAQIWPEFSMVFTLYTLSMGR